ncbi:Presumed portal vertex protein, partial [Escherichia coli]
CVFVRNELIPLQERIKGLNSWSNENIIQFKPYTLEF